jgi:alkylhydroperoxidase family enzyme
MTWLPGVTASEADSVLGLLPTTQARWYEALSRTRQMTDPALLGLAALRAAQLHGCDALLADAPDDRLRELEHWRSGGLGEPERAVLDWTEQFVVDQNGLTPEQRAAMGRLLDERELYNFAFALWTHDAHARALTVLGVERDRLPGEPPQAGGGAAGAADLEWSSAEASRLESLIDGAYWDSLMAFGKDVCRRTTIDPYTSELCRLRNANHQRCLY